MNQLCQSNSLIGEQAVYADVEIAWTPGKVHLKGMLYRNLHWTPEQAEQVAAHLLSAAARARE